MGRMCRAFRAGAASDRGQAIVEMAFVLPVVFAMIMATMELGFAFNAYTTVMSAASHGARAGAVYLFDPNASPDANDTNRESGTGTSSPYLDNVRDTVAASLGALKNTPPYFYKSGDGVQISYTLADPHFDSRQGDLINVTVTYHYRPLTGFFGSGTIPITGEASERVE